MCAGYQIGISKALPKRLSWGMSPRAPSVGSVVNCATATPRLQQESGRHQRDGPADAERRLRELVAELERPYPSAAACLAEDLSALCIHLNYFPRLRKRFRSSNLLERSLEEVRRRTKVIGRFPGEMSCLSMCWAVLDLFLAGARGLGLSDLEYKQVGPMKIAHIHHPPTVSKVA